MRILACQECKRQWDVTGYDVGQRLRCVCTHVREGPRPTAYAPDVHHCEACGAARSGPVGPCRYCEAAPTSEASKLSLVCPFCCHRTAHKSKFCSTCGEAIHAASLDAKTGNLDCPRCNAVKLFNRKVGPFTVDECPHCSGMWLEAKIFERLVRKQTSRKEGGFSGSGRRSSFAPRFASVPC